MVSAGPRRSPRLSKAIDLISEADVGRPGGICHRDPGRRPTWIPRRGLWLFAAGAPLVPADTKVAGCRLLQFARRPDDDVQREVRRALLLEGLVPLTMVAQVTDGRVRLARLQASAHGFPSASRCD